MTAVRGLLIAVGVALGLYGAVLLWDNPRQILIRIVVWAAAGVLAHDAAFAPACVALGFAGRRLLPRSTWTPVMVAGLCTAVIGMLAIPVYGKPGLQPDNPTVLDRDYHHGVWVSLAVVWGAALLYLLGSRLLPVRENQVVEK